jgi:hypothetical protein
MKILGVETSGAKREPGTFGWLVQRNAALRDVFAAEPRLQARLLELQRWQSQRLLRSHDDLHRAQRYRLAIEFFFDELYGGSDPRGRDRDLLKVQRVMERLLPAEALNALSLAVELEILSQELDAEVTRALPAGAITVETYAEAYRAAGRRPDRERQILLLGEIGTYLDKVVRKPIVRTLVRLARRPAHAAGFGDMQDFLEHGLEAFEAMHGADEFLETIRSREWRYLERLFASVGNPFEFGNGQRSGTGG